MILNDSGNMYALIIPINEEKDSEAQHVPV